MSDTRDFDKEAAGWDDKPGRVRLAKLVVAAILNKIAPDAQTKALDFGCGTGLVSLGLSPHVQSLAAFDTSSGMLEALREKLAKSGIGNVTPCLLDSAPGPELGVGYDLIVSSMTMHHVKELEPLFASFFRALNPGGKVALADLNQEDGSFHADPTGVFHLGFAPDKLSEMLSRAGFSQVECSQAATFDRPQPDGSVRGYEVMLWVGAK